MATCVNCHSAGVRPTKTLCSACYEYDRRTGRPRPQGLVVKHNDRLIERDVEGQPPDPAWMVKGDQNNHQSGRRTTGVRHWQKKK